MEISYSHGETDMNGKKKYEDLHGEKEMNRKRKEIN